MKREREREWFECEEKKAEQKFIRKREGEKVVEKIFKGHENI